MSTYDIAVDHNNPPYVLQLGDGEVGGFTVELLRAAFAAAGAAVTLHRLDGPFAQLVMLSAGRVDAAADITISHRRERWFRFSNHYYVEELQMFGQVGGPLWSGFHQPAHKIAVKANSYGQEFLIRRHARQPVVAVDTTEAQVEVVRSGRADLFVAGRETGLALISVGEAAGFRPAGAPFGPAALALAALKDVSGEVLDVFDRGVATLQRSGDLAQLRHRWLEAVRLVA